MERDAESCILLFAGLRALLGIEHTLMREVIQESKKEQKLSRLLVQNPLNYVIDQAELVVQQVRKMPVQTGTWRNAVSVSRVEVHKR